MKAIVIGGNGQLGSDLVLECQKRGWETRALTHEQIQVEDADSVRRAFQDASPDVVFNTAAFHNVPRCEEDPSRAFAVNALGALNVARAGEKYGAVTVYYSTDYVFDGVKCSPYAEEDRPNPLNVYGNTKLSGEYYALNNTSRGLAVRISGIYGRVPSRAKGGNFITTMIKAAHDKPEVRVVNDEILSPTPTTEIARASADLVESGATGLFHVVSEGECAWYEFARVIFDTLGLATPLLPCRVLEFPSAVRRPSYSALNNAGMRALGLTPLPHWRDSLLRFLKDNRAGLNV